MRVASRRKGTLRIESLLCRDSTGLCLKALREGSSPLHILSHCPLNNDLHFTSWHAPVVQWYILHYKVRKLRIPLPVDVLACFLKTYVSDIC